jgi:MSHA biogenesis protein MshN
LAGALLLLAALVVVWQQRKPVIPVVAPQIASSESVAGTKSNAPQPASRLDYDLERVPSADVLSRKKASSKAVAPEAPHLNAAEEKIAAATPTISNAVSNPIVGQPLTPTSPPKRSVVIGKPVSPQPSNTQIEKQDYELTPAQQAENEYRRGVELLNQGRLPEAQDAFNQALLQSPTHTAARQTLFGLLINLKKNDEAEHLLQDGLALNPAQPGFARALAGLQATRGDIPAAIETLRASEASAQNSADYLAFLAGLLQREAQHEDAVAHYQAALKLSPQSGVWWMGLGISLQALNRNADARDAFTHAKASNALTPELQAFVEQRLKQVQ